MQKTIFITGASTGLGKATAKLFQSKGWRVIATMRAPEKDEELKHLPGIILMALDVTQPDMIRSVAAQALALGDVDVVFNNAGYGLVGPMESFKDEQIARQLNTNVVGVMRVTQAFIPHFRARQAGVFITTTSMGGLLSFPLSSIYHATKWALEGWTESLSFELGLFNIKAKTVAPGGIATDFGGRSLEMQSHPAYDQAMAKLMALFKPETFSSAEQIAEVVYEAATDNKDQVRYVAGNDANALYARRNEIGSEAFRKELGTMVLGS